MLILLVAGVAAFFSLGQNEDPPFTFRAMVIKAEWPGATPLQMSKQVSEPIETKLKTLSSRAKITSFSREGESTIIFQVRGDITGEKTPIIWANVRNKIKDIRPELPNGLLRISFNDDFGDTYGIIFALSAPLYSPSLVDRFVRNIRNDFLSIRDVAKVEIFGQQKEKIYIEFSRRILSKYNLTPYLLSNQLKENNSIVFSGNIEQPKSIISLRVEGQFESLEEIKNIRINTNQDVVQLGEIARVFRSLPDPYTQKVRSNGKDVIALGVSMKNGGDIISLGHTLDAKVKNIISQLPVGMTLTKIQDQPKAVSKSVNEFLIVFFEAIVIVLIVILITLGLKRDPLRFDFRPGLVVALSIPLVMAITFLIMKLWGIGLHKVSLGALIIALGLLVDDAIIVIEMMFRKINQGFSPLEAVSSSYDLNAKPMLTGTLITALGFLPIGLAKSEVGEYTFAIYAVTASALIVSWVVSVFFVPVLGFWLLNQKKTMPFEKKIIKKESLTTLKNFRKVLNYALKYKFLSFFLIVSLCFLGFLGLLKVEKQFFPESNRPEILVDIYLSENASPEAIENKVILLEKKIKELEYIDNIVSWLGSGAPRFFLPLDIIFPNPNVAQIIVSPVDRKHREDLLNKIRLITSEMLPDARVRLKVLPNGPPIPYPVSFRLLSDNEKDLHKSAEIVKEVLANHPNLIGVHNNWGQKTPVIKVMVDMVRARELGVNPLSISNALKVRSAGIPIGEFRDQKQLIPIELRLNKDERDQISDLRGILVSSENGDTVPLEKIVRFSVVWESPLIWRYDNKFSMSIQGDTIGELQSTTITEDLFKSIKMIKPSFPPTVEIQIGGTVEENKKGQNSILAGLPIIFFLIFTLLVIQLSGVSRSFLVISTAPLGVSGAILALLLFERPLGFVAGLGIIALIGMIIRNSVILVDQIEREKSNGLNLNDSLVEATVGRFRPMTLTAGTAILAMVPLTNSIFWGPMAVSIMGGLFVATLLTLVLLPVMYSIFFNNNSQK